MTENEAIEELKYDCNELGKAIPCDTSWGTSMNEAYNMAVRALNEIQQYRSIGTVSECREAVEKQKPKIPNIWGDGYADGQLVYDMYDCPNCGESYEIDYSDYDYCPKCGQKINRTNLEKMEE